MDATHTAAIFVFSELQFSFDTSMNDLTKATAGKIFNRSVIAMSADRTARGDWIVWLHQGTPPATSPSYHALLAAFQVRRPSILRNSPVMPRARGPRP
jgi:hypothetical protein